MKIEFDPAKDARSQRERGLPLDFGALVLRNAIATFEDTRRDYGESRFIVFGLIQDVLFCTVYTMRGSVIRIISIRRANRKETRQWLPNR